MNCPACGNVLEEMKVGDVMVDVCQGGCGGIWFDNYELEKFDEPHESAGEELLARQRVMGNGASAGEVEDVRRQIALLVPQVEHAREALTIAREQLAASEQSFSIIPYQGPYGTRRYPVYVECTPRGVVIQPEGVLITLDDLSRLGEVPLLDGEQDVLGFRPLHVGLK